MLKQRIITAIIALAVLGIVLFVVPPVVARCFIVALIAAGAWEWGGFLFAEGRGGRLAYVAFIAALMAVVWMKSASWPVSS